MKAIVTTLVLLMAANGLYARTLDVSSLEKKLDPATRARLSTYHERAIKGDYQAMRNIAYTWSTDAAREQSDAAVVGCAWYAQIMQVHMTKANAGDADNRELYCSRLSKDDLQAAATLSNTLGQSITSARR